MNVVTDEYDSDIWVQSYKEIYEYILGCAIF